MGLLDDCQQMAETDLKKCIEQLNETNGYEMPKPLDDVKEDDLRTECVKTTPVVKRAYCPKCGKEIVSRGPVMYNPYTYEASSPYICECGWKANLEYSYPRVSFMLEDGTLIEAYAK